MKARYPLFQATVVGVHILDTEHVVHDANPSAQIDWLMSDYLVRSKRAVDGVVIGAQEDVIAQHRFERLDHGVFC